VKPRHAACRSANGFNNQELRTIGNTPKTGFNQGIIDLSANRELSLPESNHLCLWTQLAEPRRQSIKRREELKRFFDPARE
jgi:hypothetical protein